MEILSLHDLNQLIKSVLDSAFPQTFLVTAEIASCDVKNHCYLTLIEKDGETIKAEIRAVIWANKYKVISPMFREIAGTDLAKGIKILFEAEVTFHERYGLKLNILDIDPSYTIGELAIRRKEILQRLTKEGLLNRNKELAFPLVPQRIGIISSATAAGYEDIMTHLINNAYGYRFSCKLYEAIMQGERAEASILNAFNQCLQDAFYLDVVVIVRGGGGEIDLHCFDSYEIGKAIAFLPLPVISGIGHQRNITVVDEVSNMRAKTPTAVADLIISRVKDFEETVDSLAHNLGSGAGKLTLDMRDVLSSLLKNLEIAVRNKLLNNFHRLNTFINGLQYSLKFIQNERQRLKSRESNINHLNPSNVLRRGYSITYNNGKAVKYESDLEIGDRLKTVLFKGEIISSVQSKKKAGGNYE